MAIAPFAANGLPVLGQISTPDTFDLHSISLTAGEPFVFMAWGMIEDKGTLGDPNISIGTLDTSGNFIPIKSSNGSRLSIDPAISFTPPTTGIYIVAVGSDVPGGTGTYTLEAALSGSLLAPSFGFDYHIYSF
jgi:hypothetical protein